MNVQHKSCYGQYVPICRRSWTKAGGLSKPGKCPPKSPAIDLSNQDISDGRRPILTFIVDKIWERSNDLLWYEEGIIFEVGEQNRCHLLRLLKGKRKGFGILLINVRGWSERLSQVVERYGPQDSVICENRWSGTPSWIRPWQHDSQQFASQFTARASSLVTYKRCTSQRSTPVVLQGYLAEPDRSCLAGWSS